MSDRYAERMQLVNNLRDLAAWWEAADWWDSLATGEADLAPMTTHNVFVHRRETLAGIAKCIGRADKGEAGGFLYLRVPAGIDGAGVDFNISRAEVCDRVVVGAKEIEATVVPAHTEEIVEWRCRSILSDGSPA